MFRIASKYLPNKVVDTLTSTYFKTSTLLRRKHSSQSTIQIGKMKVRILPALTDNYMYLIVDERSNEAAVIDPVTPDTVLQAIEKENVKLTKILTTHHHWDHAGGNKELVSKYGDGDLEVYGGDQRIEALTHEVKHGDQFQIGDISVQCIFTPCHTRGHMCYYLTAEGQTPAVFTGDTLFVGGCGRFFEGTPQQMHAALMDKLAALGDETHVFCGHEYTVQNLRFAQHVEADNGDVKERIAWALAKRDANEPTVPSTIGDEKRTNPFMRVNQDAVQRHAGVKSEVEAMGVIRKEKDSFK